MPVRLEDGRVIRFDSSSCRRNDCRLKSISDLVTLRGPSGCERLKEERTGMNAQRTMIRTRRSVEFILPIHYASEEDD